MARHTSGHPLRLRTAEPGDPFEPKPPLPIHLHPAVAISLILVFASVVQILVWIIAQRLTVTPPLQSSAALIHGFLFHRVEASLSRHVPDPDAQAQLMFGICLVIGMLACVGWYAVGRVALGPPWGLALGTTWAAYPGYAFLAQRSEPLTVLLALLPATFAALALWYRQKKRPEFALAVGAAMGLLTLLLTITPLLVLVLTFIMPTGGRRRRRRYTSTILLWVGYLGIVLPLWTLYLDGAGRRAVLHRISADLGQRVDIGAPPDMLEDVRAWHAAHPDEPSLPGGSFLLTELWSSPGETIRWFAGRWARTLYATADGRLQRPLFMLQATLVLLATYGAVVAVRYRPWKWITITGLLFLGVFWVAAAVAEPFARNLIPISGILVLLALIALADLYERTFGRRLIRRRAPL